MAIAYTLRRALYSHAGDSDRLAQHKAGDSNRLARRAAAACMRAMAAVWQAMAIAEGAPERPHSLKAAVAWR